MARQKHSKGSSDTPIDLTTASLEKESPKVSPPFPKNYPEYPGKPYVRRARKLKSSCTLYKLPFEIRDMIFQLTLDWTGQTPRMLLALRQEPALYAQALKVFRQNNIYEFKGLERSCKMSLNAIQTIERLLLKAMSVPSQCSLVVTYANAAQLQRLSSAQLCT
jgi:hypothetical protein